MAKVVVELTSRENFWELGQWICWWPYLKSDDKLLLVDVFLRLYTQ